jgi:hypothetical protein
LSPVRVTLPEGYKPPTTPLVIAEEDLKRLYDTIPSDPEPPADDPHYFVRKAFGTLLGNSMFHTEHVRRYGWEPEGEPRVEWNTETGRITIR